MLASVDSNHSMYFGLENVLAQSLFSAIDQQSVDQWRPLVLYGESGCGKSSIALAIAKSWPGADDHPPIVTTAADLARLFQPSRLAAELDTESQKYQSAPLFVVDDIDQLADRKSVSSWLIGIFDCRQTAQLPSIVTTKSMATLRGLSSRLYSRLTAGLPVGCELPHAPTRRTIIQNATNTSVDGPLVQSLVEQTAGLSVSGTRNMVVSHLTAANNTPDVQDTIAHTHHVAAHEFPQRCLHAVARRFGIRVADIKGSSRRKNTVLARSIAMFLIRETTSHSLVETGRYFQNRDHTTVRHACEKIKKLMLTDQHIQDAVRSICVSLHVKFNSQWPITIDGKCA